MESITVSGRESDKWHFFLFFLSASATFEEEEGSGGEKRDERPESSCLSDLLSGM